MNKHVPAYHLLVTLPTIQQYSTAEDTRAMLGGKQRHTVLL